jgi:hypothetical protein
MAGIPKVPPNFPKKKKFTLPNRGRMIFREQAVHPGVREWLARVGLSDVPTPSSDDRGFPDYRTPPRSVGDRGGPRRAAAVSLGRAA